MAKTIVICGPQRSGTTLVQTIVANALRSPVLPEAHIACDLLHTYKRAVTNWQKSKAYFASADEMRLQFNSFLQLHIAELARLHDDPEFLILKDPNFSLVTNLLRDLVPKFAFGVAVVRDPRDIAASFIKIGIREIDAGKESKYSKRNFNYICRKINKYYDFMMDGKASNFNPYIVRYEKFLVEPALILKELVDLAGVKNPLIKKALMNPKWLPDNQTHQENWITELKGGRLSDTSVGNYKTVLSASEIDKVEDMCGHAIATLGYA